MVTRIVKYIMGYSRSPGDSISDSLGHLCRKGGGKIRKGLFKALREGVNTLNHNT
jgi:hypothetical protein